VIARSAWRDRSEAVPHAKSEDDKLKALAHAWTWECMISIDLETGKALETVFTK